MPIRFRCGYCNRLLGIARRKAGTEATCPHCGYTVTVPEEETVEAPQDIEFVDLATPANPEAMPESTATAVPRQRSARLAGQSQTSSTENEDRPLFEKDLSDVLGRIAPPSPSRPLPSQGAAPASVSELEAVSLTAAAGEVVLTIQQATLLAVGGVVLIGLSFAAGFLIASSR